jgi:hypothetical protein
MAARGTKYVRDETGIRWAPRLPPRLLERLYRADASGLRDDEPCDDVGMRLYARCRTFVLVSRGEVECPKCRSVFGVDRKEPSACPGVDCRWSTDIVSYRASIRNHYAYPGRALEAFMTFHRSYERARTYPQKIVLIDTLIHSFHLDEARSPTVSLGRDRPGCCHFGGHRTSEARLSVLSAM